ncbi:hypothetical protein HELRODRAFT_189657 [Helobdella robusta]|uniref:Neurotransmitter-gated ion-channel ligand-binding domain-containing protein n=1 Tax=Helobdella robusta TaxID=6412 RepID=T1FR85_HELRO|nr:hypothetical protein HELRODRAFT_189657 [Helobdella robusta]ESN93036.1 hypothetical protein HELRODRAFT_189657 [Helobdella robusta]
MMMSSSFERLRMSKEECEEFVTSLKGLEATMRDHLKALASCVSAAKKEAPPTGQSAASAKGSQPLTSKPSDPFLSKVHGNELGNGINSSVTRKEKVTIYVKTVFLKVGEIDTLRDRFAADAFVQAKWREPALDGKQNLPTSEIDWSNYWSPKLSIDNVFGDPKETVWHTVLFDSRGTAMICQKRRVNGSFLEYMELNQFPFDTQDLTVSLTTDLSDKEVEFVEDPNDRCALNVESFVDEQEWKLHKMIHTWTRTREEAFKSIQCLHPVFSAACKASRRPEFFIWNILIVMFLICSLSFATFAVGVGLPQNRLQLSFILLLTTVSFKFVVNQSLPMISYLTYLDKYILSSMAILCCICVWHAVVTAIQNSINETTAISADRAKENLQLIREKENNSKDQFGVKCEKCHLDRTAPSLCTSNYATGSNQFDDCGIDGGSIQVGMDPMANQGHGTIPEIYLSDIDTRTIKNNMTDPNQTTLTTYN